MEQQIAEQIAQQFVAYYYNLLDGDECSRKTICNVYHDECCMKYEGEMYQGKAKVAEKLDSVLSKMGRMVHAITNVDTEIVPGTDIIIVVVLGQLKTEGEQHSLGFTQTFTLRQCGGNFMVTNDIFRLALFNHQ